jgi:hypothetical protein
VQQSESPLQSLPFPPVSKQFGVADALGAGETLGIGAGVAALATQPSETPCAEITGCPQIAQPQASKVVFGVQSQSVPEVPGLA